MLSEGLWIREDKVERRCEHCGERFIPRPNVGCQRYCSKDECQRARRNKWRKRKLRTDAEYRGNQHDAQKRWRENHPEYWKVYRATHPGYVERNRVLQRERNRRRRGRLIAKRYESSDGNSMRSGLYRLIPAGAGGIAKRDEYLVKLDILPSSYPRDTSFFPDCKQIT
jgi:hypothetical protein